MADIQSNIKVHIDTSQALASIKALQAQISAFHVAMGKSNAANAATSAQMQQQLISGINATGKFAASIKTIKTSAESFTSALEKNKLTMGEYFRYAGGASKTFGKLFKSEFETINKVARERVKDLQTQYIKLGRDANGAMKAIKVRPLVLDMDNLATKTALTAQKQQLLNQLLKQGSTNLLNFGKNTQWAGRQLMVGFTVPLAMFASAAIKSFNQIETAMVKIKRVYGDMATTSEETNKMAEELKNLATSYTKYGMAVADTLDMAATAAATGKTGVDLLKQVDAAAKLAALGGIDQAKALETTISLTNTFGIAADDLSGKIDFLNAVENQTILNIGDLTEAIPKAAPIIKQLGGNVQDLAFFMTAMREGGISASQGANALKSGMASIINPTKQATDLLSSFGIGIKEIVNRDKGDIKQTFLDLAYALDKLDPLNRARAIEQLFGKFQFARMSTLFKNIADQNSQASKVLALSRETPQELAILSRRELSKVSQSPTYQFQKAMQDFKTGLAPIGAEFIKVFLPIMKSLTGFIKKFNEMGPGAKGFIVGLVAVVAGLGPVLLMTFGLLANGFANIIKGFVAMKNFFNNTGKSTKTLGEQTKYMTQEQIEAAAVAASLDQVHGKLTQTFTAEREALQLLIAEYQKAAAAQGAINGGVPITRMGGVKRYATGVISVPGPKGAGDIVPAMLSPGEAVIPSKMASKYAPLISGMVNDSVPGFMSGTVGIGMSELTERQIEGRLRGISRLEEISQSVAQSELAKMPITTYGRQISPSIGRSFPGWGIGGVYETANGGRVFVKPMISVEEAKAELRATQIAREVHGLDSPVQKLVVMRDPTDAAGQRVYAALESEFNPKFANMKTSFTKDEMAKQLVASLLRGDKDLAMGNLGGNMLADVGTAGVFEKASGGKEGLARKIAIAMPSMESQAMVNLLGVKGGAKKWFAQTTSDMARSMSPAEYHTLISNEIDKILPKLKNTINNFKNLTLEEKQAYGHMVQRLEEGKKVDWSKFHGIHSAVPGLANGIVSVPGPKGAGDIYPAMLSPGEAVIPAKMSKKYSGLINGMVNDTIPGFREGVEAGHFDFSGEAGSGLPSHLENIGKYRPEFLERQLTIGITKSMENGITSIMQHAGAKVSDLFGSGQFANKITNAFVGGASYHGTTIPQTSDRNLAYNLKVFEKAGIHGAPSTADAVARHGSIAQKHLDDIKSGRETPVGPKVEKELRAMAQEGSQMRTILSDSSRAEQQRISYIRRNAETMLKLTLVEEETIRLKQLNKTAQKRLSASEIEELAANNAQIKASEILAKEDQALAQIRQKQIASGATFDANGVATSRYYGAALEAAQKPGQLRLFATGEAANANAAREVAKSTAQMYDPNRTTPYSKPARVITSPQGLSRKDYIGPKMPWMKDTIGKLAASRVGIIIQGLSPVINGAFQKVIPRVAQKTTQLGTQAGQGLERGVEQELQIKSPSRKMFNLGMQAAQGLLNGAKEKLGQAREVGRELAASANAGIASMRGGAVAGGAMGPAPINDPFISSFAPITRDNIGLSGSELDQYNANSTGTSVGRQRLARYGNVAGRIGMGALRGGGRMIGRGFNAGMNFVEQKRQQRAYYQDLNYSTRQRIAEHEAMNQERLANNLQPIPHPELTAEEQEAMRRNPTKQEKKINKQARREQRRSVGGKMMGIGMAVSTAAMMGSMMPGEVGKKAQELMPMIMGLSMVLPMLTSTVGIVVVALAAIALAIYSVNAAFEASQEAAIKNADAMGASTQAITKLSEFAGTVTSSEYMNEIRKNQFSLLGFGAGKKSFGESYAGTAAGKSLSKSLAEAQSKGNGQNATDQLYSQLSGSVMAGALSMAQAKSIALNEAMKAGNVSMGIEVVGKMQKLLGPNGEDLTKHPLKVRMNMVQESNKRIEQDFKTTTSGVQSTYGQRNSTMGGQGLMGLGFGAVTAGLGFGVGSLAAIAATGATVGSALPGLGTLIGAVVGLGVGAFMMWQTAKDAAEKAGKLTGATIADAKIALEENKQMIDSMDVYYSKKIEQLKLQGKINEATQLESQYLKERQQLVDAQAKTSQMIVDQVNQANSQSGEVGDAYVKGAEKALAMSYKNDVNQTLYIDANKQKLSDLTGKNFIDKGKQVELLLKMASKDITPSQMSHFLDLMSTDAATTKLGIDIITKFTGPTASMAGEVLGLLSSTSKLGATEQLTFMTDVKLAKTDKDAQALINAIGTETTAENIIPAKIGVEFYLKNSSALKNYEGMLAKIGPNGVKDITAYYNIIPKINKSGLATLTPIEQGLLSKIKPGKDLATFTTVMAMEFNIDDQTIKNSDAFKTWINTTGAEKGFKADANGIQRYRVDRAFAAVTEGVQVGMGAGGDNTNKGGTPETSFLDDMVAKIRNVYNWQQVLTVGWTKSKAALQNFIKDGFSGFDGLAVKLANAGAGPNLISAVLGAKPEEINKIVDKTTGQITTFGQQLITISKDLLEEGGRAGIVAKWLGLTSDEKLQERMSMFQAGLDVLVGKEKKINESYDKRIKALDEIQSINDRVSQQESDKLDVADALSRGDISAAARAAQKLKTDNVTAAINATKQSLEMARTSELDGLELKINGKIYHRIDLENEIESITALVNQHKLDQYANEVKIGTELDKNIGKQRTFNSLSGGGGSGNKDEKPDPVVVKPDKPIKSPGFNKKWKYDEASNSWKAVTLHEDGSSAGPGKVYKNGKAEYVKGDTAKFKTAESQFGNIKTNQTAARTAYQDKASALETKYGVSQEALMQAAGSGAAASTLWQKITKGNKDTFGADYADLLKSATNYQNLTPTKFGGVQGRYEDTVTGKALISTMLKNLPGQQQEAIARIATMFSLYTTDIAKWQTLKDAYNKVSNNTDYDKIPTTEITPDITNAWTPLNNHQAYMRAHRTAVKDSRKLLKLVNGDENYWKKFFPATLSNDVFNNPGANPTDYKGWNHYAIGGYISGKGTGTSDSIPAMLSNGEYVIRANAVKTIGADTLDKLNQADKIGFKNGGYNGYANGGMVGYKDGGIPVMGYDGTIKGRYGSPGRSINTDKTSLIALKLEELQASVTDARKRLEDANPKDVKRIATLKEQLARAVAAQDGYTYVPPKMYPEEQMKNFWNPKYMEHMGQGNGEIPRFNRYPTIKDFLKYGVSFFRGGKRTVTSAGVGIDSPSGNYFTWIRDNKFGDKKKTIASVLGDFNNLDDLFSLKGPDVAPIMSYEKLNGVINEEALQRRYFSNWDVFRARQMRLRGLHGGYDDWKTTKLGDLNFDYYRNLTKKANGGMVGYAPGGMVKRDTGAPNPFLDPMGWLQGLINGTYAGGGNPSAYLDNTAAKTIKTGAKATSNLYKDYIFDPSSPTDYALAAVPGGQVVKRVGKWVGKTLGKIIPKFNWRAVLDTLTARRRSVGPNILKPNSSSYVGNFGPGRYYGTDKQSLLSKWGSEYGNNVSKMTLDPRGFWSILKSKGYMPYEEYTARLTKEQSAIGGISLDKSIQNITSPFIQGLLKEGYIGTKKEDGKLLTSWILGDQKGIGIKNIGEWTRNNLWTNTKNPLQILENMVRNKFGKNNGIAYAMTTGEIVQRSIKEFIENIKSKYIKPKNDGLPDVEGATGGLLKDGKFHYANGGMVRGYAMGGYVNGGPASRYGLGTDTIPAMLSQGEYVIKKSAVDSIGTTALNSINNGESMGDCVYNYNISLNVNSTSNSNDIADAVLGQIKRLDSQRIRGNRI